MSADAPAPPSPPEAPPLLAGRDVPGSADGVLRAMLERLYGALTRGPGINCRPHRSRQRVDLTDLDALGDVDAPTVLGRLLGEAGSAELKANVPPPEGLADGFRRRPGASKPSVPEAETESEEDVRTEENQAGTGVEAAARINLEDRDPYRVPHPAAKEREAASAPEEAAEAPEAPEPEARPASPEAAYAAQRKLLTKLRALEDEARTYLHDTGVHALHLGYPLLSLPPGFAGGGKRILAPIAFSPIDLDASAGARPGVRLRAQAEDEDRLVINPALLAWIERTLGKRLDLAAAGVLDDRDDAEDPNDAAAAAAAASSPSEAEQAAASEAPSLAAVPPVVEIAALVRAVADALDLPDSALAGWAGEAPGDAVDALGACPRTEQLPAEPAIVNAAVLGLFPAGNQGLLRDTREMIEAGAPGGLAQAFLSPEAGFGDLLDAAADRDPKTAKSSTVRGERFVALADPSQALAVETARSEPCLVLHGPPGTGKSQTITNVIGDHLARGQRVLFVCDKQTALDVVYHRLEALGLDGLCARVHDPQRDRRSLYMSVRETLGGLAEAQTDARSEAKLEKVDDELESIHAELTSLHAALMLPPAAGSVANPEEGFHELCGRFLQNQAMELPSSLLAGTAEADLAAHRRTLDLVFERGAQLGFATHPWLTQAAGYATGGLDAHLGRDPAITAQRLAEALARAEALDALDAEAEAKGAAAPPLDASRSLEEQERERALLLGHLRWLAAHPDPAAAAHAAVIDAASIDSLRGLLRDGQSDARTIKERPLDAAVAEILADNPPGPAAVAADTGALDQYLEKANRWYAFLLFGPKKLAAEVLRRYGKTLSVGNATAVREALNGLAVRRRLDGVLEQVTGARPNRRLPGDGELLRQQERWERLLAVRAAVAGEGHPLRSLARAALQSPEALASLADCLERSPERSGAVGELERALAETGVLCEHFCQRRQAAARARTEPSGPALAALAARSDDVESVLRFAEGLAALPEEIAAAADPLLRAGVSASEADASLRKRCIRHELARRVAGDPKLSRLDAEALEHAADRFAKLEKRKRGLVRDVIVHRWTEAQKRRLLNTTGNRLNSVGTAVRQRLFVTGKRAMRLRQVIRLGRSLGQKEAAERDPALLAGDPAVLPALDPLFDLRPVWLASPEAVAQCFPRDAVFDLVVFDEASQLRLEEALPVLTRAKRAVIAGDPQQLPPTRFFEAAFDEGENTGAIETEDDLFEAQQRGTEDLLSSALNLDAASTYLDVHYRSEDPGLIAFSNEHFYRGRLQALPTPPSRRSDGPAVRLQRVDGTYLDRTNPAEAEAVVQKVRELLAAKKPPSVGIACFNTTQRDAISEALESAALDDDDFAARLDAARSLERDGQREGLFVKNLENVQGDERDHLIISTTYGPDAQGRFYRRFGPLGMAGGGRRLNVLVTRARAQIHLLTSVPAAAYRGLGAPPSDSTPSGSWLLFAYLAMADQAASVEPAARELAPGLTVHPSSAPSSLAQALGGRVAALAPDARVEVHAGNEGFLLDIVTTPPTGPTTSALVDFARYSAAPDPVRWDLYRRGILHWRGWKPNRVWSPTVLREPTAAVESIVRR